MYLCVNVTAQKNVTKLVFDSDEATEIKGSSINKQDLEKKDFMGQITGAITDIVGKISNIGMASVLMIGEQGFLLKRSIQKRAPVFVVILAVVLFFPILMRAIRGGKKQSGGNKQVGADNNIHIYLHSVVP